ncbi:anti-sigma factor [Paenibacillus sp. BR1-192]|uniref:anti-sigma factor n=1 Tax=Paenibacillus sp. BR1-192 TaxID=3032287 RepID=UPI00240E75D5|nr:anti-sigma factor [Paenibacillus sp. BR1-192]WFB60337.1 anti-sigma factor [Paenibacillus sp. BR1-192]
MKLSKHNLEHLVQGDSGCTAYPEEKLVDYVMKRLPYAESRNLELHLKECEACSGTAAEWAGLMGAENLAMPFHESDVFGQELFRSREMDGEQLGSTQPAGTEPAIRGAVQDQAPNDGPMPPDRLRHRLMRAAYIRSFRSKVRIRKHAALQAISGALLILLIAGLFTLKGNDVQTQAAFEHTVSQRIADMQSDDTERYVIQPVEPFYGSGSVWLKRGSGEMLIVVNGLHSLQEKDYQVWLQDEERLSSAGFMLVQGPQGKSYYYGFGAENAKRIVVSMEPKGGAGVRPGPKPSW